MNAEQLWDTTMNPENRTLRQVTIENAAESDNIFSMLMGDDVPPRREFIEANAKPAASSADRELAPAAQPPARPQPLTAAQLDSKTPVAPTAPKEIVALVAAELEEAVARYSKTTVLRALLTHDPALGGVAIKLISVGWLISYFQANPTARLEHRQQLELTTPEAFVEGAKLERVLAELETGGSHGVKDEDGYPIKECVYMTEVGGKYKAVTNKGWLGSVGPVPIAFPSAAAMSHMCVSLPSTCGVTLTLLSLRRLAVTLSPSNCEPSSLPTHAAPSSLMPRAGGSQKTIPTRTPRTCATSGCPPSSGTTRRG